LDISSTFTTGAFTGVTAAALRVNGNVIPSSAGAGSLGTASLPFSNALFTGTVFSNNIQAYSSHLNFNTTSFTTVGRFFQSTGNFTLQNGGTFTDAGFRLDVNGTARVVGQTTIAGAVNASGGFVRGTFFNQTLVATANNDTLYAIDINPTYTVGAFTGVTRVPLRIRNAANTANAFYVDSSGNATLEASLGVGTVYGGTNINLSSGSGNLLLQTNYTGNTGLTMFNATRNVVIQNGGTFTDIASARLAVNSTTQGFLPPRMTNAQRLAIASPAVGLIVYCTDAVEGLYVNKSTGWTFVI
jgi:hypothetical protein